MLKLIKNKLGRSTALTVSLALVLLLAVGGTVAFLIDFAGPVVNTFTPSDVEITVEEDFDEITKKNVRILNIGDTYVYIRVAIIANWHNADGEIVAPAMVDLGTLPTGWVKSGNYYYYTETVAPQGYTEYLIGQTGYTPTDGPDGAHLEMTILAQAVQSTPVEAVIEAWGIDPSTLNREVTE